MAKKKDSLGKLLLTSGNANAAFFAGGLGVLGLGVVVAVVALFTAPLALIGAAVVVLAGGLGVWVGLTGQARIFEVRTKGVRSVHRGEATEIHWDELKRVVVRKSLRGKQRNVMRITNLADGTQEYRGEMVMYEFTFTGGGEKIVFSTGGPTPSVHPRTLLSRLEEFARGKVTVHEPDQEVYFDD
ncbi:MAG TPA: hypothetical protein VD866_17280 [Urbifossiella sp.]|nr:hypothetical protein [Urbifossiella sp.]